MSRSSRASVSWAETRLPACSKNSFVLRQQDRGVAEKIAALLSVPSTRRRRWCAGPRRCETA
jgi:hypothetical protein